MIGRIFEYVTSYFKRRSLEFACSDRIESHADIARDFFPKVFLLEFDDCFISDESHLSEFYGDPKEQAEIYDRIQHHFGIDPSVLKDDLLISVFEAIRKVDNRTRVE